MAAVKNQEMDYAIKPEAVNPAITAEEWPLLLKNYHKCMFHGEKKKKFNAILETLANPVII
jgi:hypothetical protein